jgi:hypothetical protein
MMSNASNPLGTWITLSQAAQFAARLAGVDERIVVIMDADTWALEARRKIERGDWPAEMEAELRKAEDLLKTLGVIFAAGRVAGEGSHVPHGPAHSLASITELEWASRYVHFWKNELQPKGSEEHFPPIIEVRVRTEDVRRELETELEGCRKAKPIANVRALIRAEADRRGRDLSEADATKTVKDAGAFENREKLREAWRTEFPERKQGPKGPRGNRAATTA